MREMLGRNNIQPPSCLRCTVLRKERLSSQGRHAASLQLTHFHRRNTSIRLSKRLWNVAPNIRHSAPENSLQMLLVNVYNSLQQTILTHVHTKCSPACKALFSASKYGCRRNTTTLLYCYSFDI